MCLAAVSRLFLALLPAILLWELARVVARGRGGEKQKSSSRSWLGFSAAEERNFVAPASSAEEEEEDGGSFNQTAPAALLCPRCPGRIANF